VTKKQQLIDITTNKLYGAYLIVEDKQVEWEVKKKIREANKMADRLLKETNESKDDYKKHFIIFTVIICILLYWL
jgi:hypothetical protein